MNAIVPLGDIERMALAGSYRRARETVGDLDGMRRPARAAVDVGRCPIPADHLHTWMGLEPGGQGVGRSVRQEVDGPMML